MAWWIPPARRSRVSTPNSLDGRPSWSAHPDTSAISEERVMTTELFDRKPSAGAQLARQFDWQAKKIRGVYFPDLEKLPLADKAARQAQIRKIAGDCGCRFGAAFALIATALYGAALGLSAISVSASPFWNFASVAGVFVVAAIAGRLL